MCMGLKRQPAGTCALAMRLRDHIHTTGHDRVKRRGVRSTLWSTALTVLLGPVWAVLPYTAEGRDAFMYRWQEGDTVIYGDSPPAGSRSETLRLQGSELRIELKDPAYSEGAGSSVVLLSRTDCEDCDKVRAYLQARAVPFNEFDVESSELGRREYGRLLGGRLPITLVGNKGAGGFNRPRLDELLTEAGY